MLASIAVVSILALLMAAPLKRIMSRAKSTKCLANLRQMGNAALQYANDNQGNLPPAYLDKSPNGSWVFYRLLNQYLGPFDENTDLSKYPKVYRCPEDPAPFLSGTASYAANQCCGKSGVSSGNIFDPNLQRSKIILFVDATRAALRPGWGGAYEDPAFRHDGTCNAIMMDGSTVRSFKKGSEELSKSWGL